MFANKHEQLTNKNKTEYHDNYRLYSEIQKTNRESQVPTERKLLYSRLLDFWAQIQCTSHQACQ